MNERDHDGVHDLLGLAVADEPPLALRADDLATAGRRRLHRRRVGLAATGLAVVGLTMAGIAVAPADTGPPPTLPGATAATPSADGSKPPVVIPDGEVKEPPLPESEKLPEPSAPDPGPQPKALDGVKVPDDAAVVAAVGKAAPSLQAEAPEVAGKNTGEGKHFFGTADAQVQVDVRAGGSPEAEVQWALAEARHAGTDKDTQVRTLAGGSQAVVTKLPQASYVVVSTAAGLRVGVAVNGVDEGKAPAFTAEQALEVAEAVAALS